MQTFKIKLKGYQIFSYSTDDGMSKKDAEKAMAERFPDTELEAVMTEQEYLASFSAEYQQNIKRPVRADDVLQIERWVNDYQGMYHNVKGRSYLDFAAYNTTTDLLNQLNGLDVSGTPYELPVKQLIEHLSAQFNLKAMRLVSEQDLDKMVSLSNDVVQLMATQFGVKLRGKQSAIVDIDGMVPDRFRDKLNAQGVVTNKLGLFFCKGEKYVPSALSLLCDVDLKALKGDKPITQCRAGVVVAYSPQDMLLVVKDIGGPVDKVTDLEHRVMVETFGFKAKETLPDGTVKESYFVGDRERLEMILSRKSASDSVKMFYSSEFKESPEHSLSKLSTNVARIDNYIPTLERKAFKTPKR